MSNDPPIFDVSFFCILIHRVSLMLRKRRARLAKYIYWFNKCVKKYNIFNFKLSRAKKTTKFPCRSTQILLCFSYQNWITHSPHSTWPFWLNFGTKNNDPVDNIVLQFAIKTMPVAVLIQILNTINNPSFHKQYHSNANWMNKTT